mmetsp:Transcript_51372/g.115360  ORF Transcript_51372/g.115360 Transcript_51372/m.115360 type:complete len:324 (-) Transcript_51372:360-1331(-)
MSGTKLSRLALPEAPQRGGRKLFVAFRLQEGHQPLRRGQRPRMEWSELLPAPRPGLLEQSPRFLDLVEVSEDDAQIVRCTQCAKVALVQEPPSPGQSGAQGHQCLFLPARRVQGLSEARGRGKSLRMALAQLAAKALQCCPKELLAFLGPGPRQEEQSKVCAGAEGPWMVRTEVAQAALPGSPGEGLRLSEVFAEVEKQRRQVARGGERIWMLATSLLFQPLQGPPKQRLGFLRPTQLTEHQRQVHAEDQRLCVVVAKQRPAPFEGPASVALGLLETPAAAQEHGKIGPCDERLRVLGAQGLLQTSDGSLQISLGVLHVAPLT